MTERCTNFIVPLVFLLFWTVSCTDYYSCFFYHKLTSDQVEAYKSNGTFANCTIAVAPCNETEPRRINGTCNNLKFPSRGGARTPYRRLLPPVFNRTSDSVYDPRLSVCNGGKLKDARYIRQVLLSDGSVEDSRLTHAVTHFSVFFATDITNTQDTTNYVSWRPFCCKPEGAKDPMCAPNPVPSNDYIHRFSGITCLNMTRPLTYQTSGCLPETTTPLRIVDATPTDDMSPVYGNEEEPGRRTFKNGMLRTETIDGIEFPPTSGIKLLLGVNFIGIIFFWRFHNHIAKKLVEINPCWTDEQVFTKAREINIACGCEMLYYELMALLMGEDHLINDGVLIDTIASDSYFRDVYDETLPPGISLEYPAVQRWMHKMQGGLLNFYDSKGNFLNQTFPMVNLTSNLNFIKRNGTMKYISQQCFRQACAKSDDDIVDTDILNLGLGGLQRANDIITNDIAKVRYYGLRSYVEYRYYCFGDNITSFDDLEGIISKQGIAALKLVYVCVFDIEFMTGVNLELPKEGAFVPPMYYCIVKEQLLYNIKSDRFWYENPNSPNALTEAQMNEIRNFTLSRMLCDVGDSVIEIQPSAFELPNENNEVVPCSEIVDLDYTAWKDETCKA